MPFFTSFALECESSESHLSVCSSSCCCCCCFCFCFVFALCLLLLLLLLFLFVCLFVCLFVSPVTVANDVTKLLCRGTVSSERTTELGRVIAGSIR